MIISFSGLIGSGKDTCADTLVYQHGFRRDSFARSLKESVSAIFGWPIEMINGTTPEARLWREQVDEWWAERFQKSDLTPRWVLQHFGTDVCRNHFNDDIWVASLERRLLGNARNTVITDCRFPNEIAALRRAGALIVRVQRSPLPEWWSDALDGNADALRERGIHASEWAWAASEFDIVIENNGTLEELREKVSRLVCDK